MMEPFYSPWPSGGGGGGRFWGWCALALDIGYVPVQVVRSLLDGSKVSACEVGVSVLRDLVRMFRTRSRIRNSTFITKAEATFCEKPQPLLCKVEWQKRIFAFYNYFNHFVAEKLFWTSAFFRKSLASKLQVPRPRSRTSASRPRPRTV